MTKGRWVAIFAWIGVVSALVFAYKSIGGNHPVCPGCNVILISLDQVRAKSLPCFGYSQNTMPNLCAFASRSHVFTNAYATASRTMDSHFSMMTSQYPSTHAMNVPYASVLPAEIPTLAGLLKNEGYNTYFFGPAGDPHLPMTKGLERGFDQMYQADSPQVWMETMNSIASASGSSQRPSFFFLHTYDAHEPYMPKEDVLKLFYSGPDRNLMTYEDLCRFTYTKLQSLHPDRLTDSRGDTRTYCTRLADYQQKNIATYEDFDDTYSINDDKYWQQFDDLPKDEKARYTHALYSGQIYMLDRELGKFFDYLEKNQMMQRTVIIIVGDQGDEFFEHNAYSHGWSLYNEVLHVPFIMYVPKSGSSRSAKLISLVDIMPTIYRTLGKNPPSAISGIDAFRTKKHSMILAEHVSDGAIALRTDRYTLIRRIINGAFQLELFDIQKDPGEQLNIFRGNTAVVESLLRQYKTLQSSLPKFTSTPEPFPTWLKDDDRKRLIESGYF